MHRSHVELLSKSLVGARRFGRDMTSSHDWGLARRIGFRFGIVYGVLVLFPFPLNALPKMQWLTGPLEQPFDWLTQWFARVALGLPELATAPNGSGDRTFDYVKLLLFAIFGVVGAIAWSALDRRRSYPRLAAAAHVVLRYSLAHAMLFYGFAKILRLQFSDLSPFELRSPVGEVSPMGLLWRFMGYSAPYTVFGGLCEAIPGLLLLWRRTAAIGAVMAIAVMINVVMLNLSYDVCVKLYSMQLLVMAWLIALPDARRLLAAALGRATAEIAPRVRMSARRERARLIGKAIFILGLAVGIYLASVGRGGEHHELHGNWVVDAFSADGGEQSLAGDSVRWQSVAFTTSRMAIWRVSGDRDPQVTTRRGTYAFKVDAANHTITVTIDDDTKQDETWRYTRPAPDRLVIDGVHLGKVLHVALHAAPEPLLVTREFHWINEQPFSR
jgi:hypothetical protein